MPELRESVQMADMIISAGYYIFEELAEASTAERAQLYKVLGAGRAGWFRLLRKMLGAESPPTDVEVAKSLPYKEVDIFAAIRANPALSGNRELLRPRQGAVGLSPKRFARVPRRRLHMLPA